MTIWQTIKDAEPLIITGTALLLLFIALVCVVCWTNRGK